MKSRVYYYESYQDDFGITDNIKKTIVGDSYKYKANKKKLHQLFFDAVKKMDRFKFYKD